MGMKNLARRLTTPNQDLVRRVTELEAEVQECRQLNQRLAELTDIVADLLVPLARGDQDGLRETLTKYHESL